VSAENFISRLEGVRHTSVGRWIARCPAHEDKSPSLNIREKEDGRLLIHCFAGCSAFEIVSALGLELSDLFPAKAVQYAARERRPFSADDALRCLAFESTLLLIVAHDLADGKTLNEGDRSRLLVSAGRIASAESLCHGK